MNDTEIREFFHQNRPVTADEGTFKAGLNARLDAIEEVKRIHDAEVARCHKVAHACFIAGLALGAAVVALLIMNPVDVPHFDLSMLAPVSAFIAEWKAAFILAIAVLALVLGLIPWGRSDKQII